MEGFLKEISNYFLSLISQHSYFIDWNYYSGLFSKYFSVAGFIIGLIFVLIIFGSSAEGQEKAGFLKVVPIIAVINSCVVLSDFLNTIFKQEVIYTGVESTFNAPDNIISGFILTLVISSCYREYGKQAFWFGVATHAALPFLNFSYIELMDGATIILMIVRVILAGVLCLILSHREYFYTSWIWYFGFHMFLRGIKFLIPLMGNLINGQADYASQYTFAATIQYFSQFSMDVIIFVIVLVFGIVFEKGVLES